MSEAPSERSSASEARPERSSPTLRVLRIVGGTLLAIAVGVASAWYVLRRVDAFGQAAGPWRVSVLAGSAQADAYTRARVALGGLLALNLDETMYYVATTDSGGAPLRSRCRYRVSGKPPPARWWSVTAYADDFFLFPNDAHRYSLNGSTAVLDADGRFTLLSGPDAPASAGATGAPAPASASAAASAGAGAGGAGDDGGRAAASLRDRDDRLVWLPTPGDRGLLFTLRVYNPDAALRTAPGSLPAPRIDPIGDCR